MALALQPSPTTLGARPPAPGEQNQPARVLQLAHHAGPQGHKPRGHETVDRPLAVAQPLEPDKMAASLARSAGKGEALRPMKNGLDAFGPCIPRRVPLPLDGHPLAGQLVANLACEGDTLVPIARTRAPPAVCTKRGWLLACDSTGKSLRLPRKGARSAR